MADWKRQAASDLGNPCWSLTWHWALLTCKRYWSCQMSSKTRLDSCTNHNCNRQHLSFTKSDILPLYVCEFWSLVSWVPIQSLDLGPHVPGSIGESQPLQNDAQNFWRAYNVTFPLLLKLLHYEKSKYFLSTIATVFCSTWHLTLINATYSRTTVNQNPWRVFCILTRQQLIVL